jgi:hypothetical protein
MQVSISASHSGMPPMGLHMERIDGGSQDTAASIDRRRELPAQFEGREIPPDLVSRHRDLVPSMRA